MAEAARSQPAGIERIEFEPREIRWGRYDLDVDSVRVALALDNPLLLDGHAERLGDGWRLHLRARATTHYPRRGRLVLLQDRRGHDVVIDESLFWALQELGWLHEFTAEWRWSTDAADPWLDDLETPRLGWREQVLVLIDRGLS